MRPVADLQRVGTAPPVQTRAPCDLPVDEHSERPYRDPFTVDPDTIDRGNQSHRMLQQRLSRMANRVPSTWLSNAAQNSG